jgi:alkanesulfonate monooxygenase SsuD/methylene tetrahydromethanopterin reductase-like flavin-dependent oxidoreductase (luciferase family)
MTSTTNATTATTATSTNTATSNRRLIRTGLQMSFFDAPGVPPAQLFGHLAAQAQSAERAGFDAVTVMDHVLQLPFLGGPQAPIIEGYTLLAGLAACTERVLLGTLVTGVTYRNPALLAKMVTSLDLVSGGRAMFGVGAAWYADEHAAYDFEFPPVPERFALLEEAIHIAQGMFGGTDPVRANVPGPLRAGGPPLLIGGAGERRTLRLAAQYAAASNFNCMVDEVPHKLTVLQGHLDAVGRSRDDINVTLMASVVTAPSVEATEAKLRGLMAMRGMDPAVLDDPKMREMITSRMIVGSHEQVGEQIAALCGPSGAGLDGVIVMLPADVANPEGPEEVAGALRAAGLLG